MNKIEISGSFAPAILNTLNGAFLVSGGTWIKVPETTKLSDVVWANNKHVVSDTGNVHMVRSSDGKSEYKVQMIKGTPTCTCRGFGFNKSCRHIFEVFPFLS